MLWTVRGIGRRRIDLDRDTALQAARERFEQPIWDLLGRLETTLTGLAGVEHMDLGDARAVGSVLNCALPDAASAANLEADDLAIAYCQNGQSNKITGTIALSGDDHNVSFEMHLCGPRGGTSKSSHQFAGYDIEREPKFPGFDVEAPPSLLLFIACFLNGTGVRFERVFLKFADGVDQRKIEIFRDIFPEVAGAADSSPAEGPEGAKLRVKKPEGEKEEDGSETNQRGDAASSSQKT